MAEPEVNETPLMRQYLEIKERHPDCILFFRLGDFYEMFFDDAKLAAQLLDLTLTSRDKNKENPVPMCGVPHHAAKQYLAKLVERGHKVAICEQVEDPKLAKGIVRRDVVRVVTPGVIVDEEQLDPKAANYLVALVAVADAVGVAHLDVSTGEFATTELSRDELVSELCRLQPREIVSVGVARESLHLQISAAWSEIKPADRPETIEEAKALLHRVLDAKVEIDAQLTALAMQAAATVLAYALRTQPGGELPVTRLIAYRPSEQLLIDDSSRSNLELFQPLRADGDRRSGTLLGVLDQTCTAIGGRLLRRWLAAPLIDVAQIRRRQDAVEWLVEHAALRAELAAELRQIYDLERLAGRAALGVCSPRDLVALAKSLERLPGLRTRLAEAAQLAPEARLAFPELLLLSDDLAADIASEIRQILVEDPPALWREGGFCRRGFSAELDELLTLSAGGRDRILEIEARERERSGIASLKIRYNRVFGYYLEITRSNLERVPADYIRKQTLANAERYVTPELAELEERILHADERRLQIELTAFEDLRGRVAQAVGRILPLAETVARIDVLYSFAELAHRHDYCRPLVDQSAVIEIEAGRHPVVEQLLRVGSFVPNDVLLDPASVQLIIITGPNMAGKSTVMRQVALITVLAQIGSFVPARRAHLGLVDRLFSRVGASDNLARGDSTFMVEMRETANILRQATRRSLVILDEIGRGTSTFDGMAIAWAVAEHLHDRVNCKTLLATHYHELTVLERQRPRVRNFSTTVREWKDDIVFLHKLSPGGASRSYGIQVARLAGVVPSVLKRAKELVVAFERGEELGRGLPESAQLSLLAPPPETPTRSDIEQALLMLDIDSISPREALATLAEWQAKLRK